MSYLKKKEEFLRDKTINQDVMLGMEAAENLAEQEVRELVAPYAELIQKLNKLVDTKKPSVRDDIFKWILENPETIRKLNNNVDNLINFKRI